MSPLPFTRRHSTYDANVGDAFVVAKCLQTRRDTTMTLRANRASVRLRVVITSRVTSYGHSHGLAADDHGVGPCGVYTRHPIDTVSPFGHPRTNHS